jgi:hypothetical protein
VLAKRSRAAPPNGDGGSKRFTPLPTQRASPPLNRSLLQQNRHFSEVVPLAFDGRLQFQSRLDYEFTPLIRAEVSRITEAQPDHRLLCRRCSRERKTGGRRHWPQPRRDYGIEALKICAPQRGSYCGAPIDVTGVASCCTVSRCPRRSSTTLPSSDGATMRASDWAHASSACRFSAWNWCRS